MSRLTHLAVFVLTLSLHPVVAEEGGVRFDVAHLATAHRTPAKDQAVPSEQMVVEINGNTMIGTKISQ